MQIPENQNFPISGNIFLDQNSQHRKSETGDSENWKQKQQDTKV